jgi:SAM-dependent methyltransferase
MTVPFPPLAIRARLRRDVIRPIIARVSPTSTLEVGVGQGAISARIASMTSESYVGFELDKDSFDRAKPRIEAAGGTVHNLSMAAAAPAPAQLLCAFEVLEHIEDDRAALEEWHEYIQPGGCVLLSVPAHQHRFGPMDEHAGHRRRYSPTGLGDLVRSIGMTDITTTLYGAPLGYALEAVRNRIDARRMDAASRAGLSKEALTAASGRTFQFEEQSWKSTVATAATVPFKHLQRVWPGGIGLVVFARRP